MNAMKNFKRKLLTIVMLVSTILLWTSCTKDTKESFHFSHTKKISSLSFLTVDDEQLSGTIKVTMNYGLNTKVARLPNCVDMEVLKSKINVSEKATVSLKSGTSMGFCAPNIFTAMSMDGSTVKFTLKVSSKT